MPATPVKIALMDSSPLALGGLCYFLDSLGIAKEIVFQESSLQKVTEALMYQSVDVLITDLYSQSETFTEGRDLVLNLCMQYPNLILIVYTSCQSGDKMRRLLCAPNVSLISRSEPLTKVADSFKQALQGRRFLSQKICGYLASQNSSVELAVQKLTFSEKEVLKQLFNGMSLGEIAQLRNLSIKTISAHKCNAMRKLSVKNDAELFIMKDKLCL
ncbi:helix-turn-helix transcriptional regulator [Ewingella americana]|uniref:helix-turn-helix transcriptional regulator n=1 Tax=Ewingella americana TaxID=41202 RepID=UPI00163A4EEC|nr:response regulator transcription factor [Ewingella americana]QMV53731.1 response regulator transcription factor [Ewingella americana]